MRLLGERKKRRKENWPNTEEWSQFQKHTQNELLIANHLLLEKTKKWCFETPKKKPENVSLWLSGHKSTKKKVKQNKTKNKKEKVNFGFTIRLNSKAPQKIKQTTTLWVTPLSANTTREREREPFLKNPRTVCTLELFSFDPIKVPELLPPVEVWLVRGDGAKCQSLLESKKMTVKKLEMQRNNQCTNSFTSLTCQFLMF